MLKYDDTRKKQMFLIGLLGKVNKRQEIGLSDLDKCIKEVNRDVSQEIAPLPKRGREVEKDTHATDMLKSSVFQHH